MIIALESRHFDVKAAHKPDSKRRGIAIDNAWKERFGELPVEKYAPLDGRWSKDYLNDGILTHEVKSFSTKSITISAQEIDFARQLESEGKDHLYWIYEQLDDSSASFLGVVPWSKIKKYVQTSKYDADQYYIMVDNFRSLLTLPKFDALPGRENPPS